MNIRYIVIDIKPDPHHPNWPNEQLFKIKDLKTGNILYGCYTKREIAESIAVSKNEA